MPLAQFGYGSGQEEPVIRKFRITAPDGKSYNTNHYSLEMIIAVVFKVNSERAVQFRKWVNQIAKDYTIKGWVMDDERLKRGTYLTEKYVAGICRVKTPCMIADNHGKDRLPLSCGPADCLQGRSSAR